MLAAIFAVIAIIPLVNPGGRVGITVERRQQLVGPEPVVQMLYDNAPTDEIIAAIEASGRHVDSFRWVGGSLLEIAIEHGRDDLAYWCLERGASPNGVTNDGGPLLAAASRKDEDMFRLLINEYGASLEIRPMGGPTLREFGMSYYTDPEIVRLFREAPRAAESEVDAGRAE